MHVLEFENVMVVVAEANTFRLRLLEETHRLIEQNDHRSTPPLGRNTYFLLGMLSWTLSP